MKNILKVTLNRSNPTAFLKLDIRFKTMITYQTFDCIIKVQTEFSNKSKEFYNDNEDIALMMFDMKYGQMRYNYILKTFCIFTQIFL